MQRYLVLIPRTHIGRVTKAGGQPREGGSWTRAYDSEGLSVLVKGESPLIGRPLCDGYCIGITARSVNDAAGLTAEWGAYVGVRENRQGDISVYRDPSGRIPAYYAASADYHLICSHVADLSEWGCEGLDIDWSYTALMLFNNSLPERRTGFVGVREILPGEEIVFRNGSPSSRFAWEPSTFYEDPFRSDEAARSELRAAALASAELWASQYRSMTLDLSGGLDSAVVLGLMAHAPSPHSITCINLTVGHPESDERQFAREAASMHGARLVEREVDACAVDYGALETLSLQPRPTVCMLPLAFHDPGAALAKELGAGAYLTGSGGDHLFFMNAPSSVAADYLLQRRDVPGWLACAYDAARLAGKPVWSVLLEAFAHPSAAARLRDAMRGVNDFASADAAQAVDFLACVHPWLQRAAERAPPGKFRHVRALVDVQRQYSRVGRAEALDEIHPLISQMVIEASMRTPAYMFARGGVRRSLQREAFRDLIPNSIFKRRTKGATTSLTVRTIARNLHHIRPLLLDGELSARGLLNRRVLEERLTSSAMLDAKFVSQLGDCIIVQLWINAARDHFRREGAGGAPAALSLVS